MAQAKRQKMTFGAWEPDDAKYLGSQAPKAENVIPTKEGYHSLPSLVARSYPAVPGGVVLQAYTVRDMNGDLYTLTASVNGKVYSLGSNTWNEKEIAETPVSNNRQFIMFGSVLYMLYGTTLYKSEVSGGFGTFEKIDDAPAAQVGAVIKDFLCLGDTTEGSDDTMHNRIHWSAMDDPDSWPAAGSDDAAAVQSDYQVFPEGGGVQAIVGGVGAADGIIFLERAVQRASYIGSPYIFNFKCIDLTHGLFAPHSPVCFGPGCVYLSDDGWYITDGSTTRPIGLERIDRWFFNELDPRRVDEITGVHDPVNRVCMWRFPSNHAPANHCDRLLIYGYDVNKWSYAVVTTQALFFDYARAKTLEDLDAEGTLDNIPIATLDSPEYQTGRLLVAAFDSSGKMATMSGTPLRATIQTAEIGGERMFVHGLRPLVDSGAAQALPIYRNRQQDQQKMGKLTSQSRDGICYQHLSTVYLAAQVEIPADCGNWTDATGVEALVELEGGL